MACAGVQLDPLFRLLRAAVNMNVLAAAPGRRGNPPRFSNNTLSNLYREDHPNSVKAMVCPLPGSRLCSAHAAVT